MDIQLEFSFNLEMPNMCPLGASVFTSSSPLFGTKTCDTSKPGKLLHVPPHLPHFPFVHSLTLTKTNLVESSGPE